MVQPRVLTQRSMRAAVGEVVIQLRESRKLGRAQQARDRQGAAGVTESRADLVRLAPQIAAQKTRQKRVACAPRLHTMRASESVRIWRMASSVSSRPAATCISSSVPTIRSQSGSTEVRVFVTVAEGAQRDS